MIAQRVGSTALRQVATRPNAALAHNVLRAATAIQTRPATTQKITSADAKAILDGQRLKRPVSPHLAIYDPQQTWLVGSIWQRITGAGFTAALYMYGAAYLVAPLTGWHLESESLAAAFGALPLAVKGGLKLTAAWAFTWHLFGGMKHFYNDLGQGFAKASMKTQGWVLWGTSLAAGGYMAFFM